MNVKFTNKQKILILVILLFILCDIILVLLNLTGKINSKTQISFENTTFLGKLKNLNNNSRHSRIKKSGWAYYKFTPEIQDFFYDYYLKNGSISVSVRSAVKNVHGKKYEKAIENPSFFYFGFLYKSDFSKKGKFLPSEKKVYSGCDLRSFIKNEKGYSCFDNALAVEKNLKPEELPCGLAVYSDYPLNIVDFLVLRAKVGFDRTKEIPFYGVSSNGGSFTPFSSSFDFSGAQQVFPVENTRTSIMPKIEFSVQSNKEKTYPNSVRINAGGDIFSVKNIKDKVQTEIQTSTLIFPFSQYEITEDSCSVLKLLMVQNDSLLLPTKDAKVIFPLKTDIGLVLSSKKSNWRINDYELYEWNNFPGILFFDFLDYSVQDSFLRRIAFFVEKEGFKGHLLTDEELGDMHGYNAHDYRAESLADFFNAALQKNFPLGKNELLLKEILLKNNVILYENGSFKAGKGAVISISRESPSYLRNSLTSHEAWHGLYFTDEDFRNTVAAVYYTVDEKTLSFMKGYWKSQKGLGYDQNDEYLMQNEFMAYLMQQPLSGVSKYFIHVANRGSVMAYQKDLCDWVKNTNAQTFEDAARVLDSYVQDRWSLACGRVSLIVRE